MNEGVGLLLSGILIGLLLIVIPMFFVNEIGGVIIPRFVRVNAEPEICWETLSKYTPSALDCLQIADNDFSVVCNQVFNDKGFCVNLWNETEIDFDPENNECFMTLPFECENKKGLD